MTSQPNTAETPLFLVCLDFGECSRQALAWADERAMKSGATLHLAHVRSPLPILPTPQGSMMPLPDPELGRRETRLAEQALRELAATCHAQCTFEVRDGAVVDSIVELADGKKPELLVLGTHGRSGIERLVLGSVCESVLRRVHCPVMVVPQSSTQASAATEQRP